ncbi:hypothetical protein J6590_015741 [Homalodisca vitripennis]|nr:hypothetical protein J6590_015741 [Homalodisca vitripennis]
MKWIFGGPFSRQSLPKSVSEAINRRAEEDEAYAKLVRACCGNLAESAVKWQTRRARWRLAEPHRHLWGIQDRPQATEQNIVWFAPQ